MIVSYVHCWILRGTQGCTEIKILIEGESVTLSCSYTATSDYIYLYWYRQHCNQGPQFILYKGARSYDGVEHIPDERFKSTTSRDSTQLTIPSLTIADTAIYYCMLYKNSLDKNFLSVRMSAGDDISSDQLEYFSRQGESVTLSCSYTATSDYIYLYWYRQHSNQGPQFILCEGARAYDGVKHSTDKQFKSATSRDSTQLTIDSLITAVTAIYYCALRDAQ
uniref:Ig-like domain-containing protein n=1 Tax=Paramormyrops kingsleyae TaxID=1676925 RepID=A0A3B3Q3F8_9TELE